MVSRSVWPLSMYPVLLASGGWAQISQWCPVSPPEAAPRHWGEPNFRRGVLWELELIAFFHTHWPGFQYFFLLGSVLRQKVGNKILKLSKDPRSMLLSWALWQGIGLTWGTHLS